MVSDRLDQLPRVRLAGELTVLRAATPRTRLLGLALLDELPARQALLLPGCSSVHTFGMRFAIDIAFLDRLGRVLRVVRTVPPRRMASCSGARAVLETRAGEAGPFLTGELARAVSPASPPTAEA